MSQSLIKKILIAAALLAFCVVVLGAYVRLSHAGLGCPDWPGCYGKIIVPDPEVHDDSLYPGRPLEHGKAWREMAHRYVAGTLGLMIFALALSSWRLRKQPGQPVAIPVFLVVLVIFQAALGMWTVTLLLKPVVVLAHLLGGMAVLVLLFWLCLEQLHSRQGKNMNNSYLLPWAITALVMLILQISLGGWTSANYAALACPDFPLCQGRWWPEADFREGFILWRGLGVDYEGGVLANEARTAIHIAHRIGAVMSFLIIGGAALRAAVSGNTTTGRLGWIMCIILLTQIGLGIANVLLRLPLPVAVAHNGVAALLLLSLVALLHQSLPPAMNRRPL